jgi:hypothetical protein
MVMTDNEDQLAAVIANANLDKEKARQTLEEMGIEFAPTPVEDEWTNWARLIDTKVERQSQVALVLAGGMVVTFALTLMVGKAVIKLAKTQADIISVLNASVASNPSVSEGERSSHVSYAKPSNRVDTSAAVVDQDLKADLEAKLAQSTTAEIPDELK